MSKDFVQIAAAAPGQIFIVYFPLKRVCASNRPAVSVINITFTIYMIIPIILNDGSVQQCWLKPAIK